MGRCVESKRPCHTVHQCVYVSSRHASPRCSFCKVWAIRCASGVFRIDTLLYGEGVREQGFHGLALLPAQGSTKLIGYAEGDWMLRTECAPGLGKCTP